MESETERITKNKIIKQTDKLGDLLIDAGIEFKTLSKSLNQRRDKYQAREMKNIVSETKSFKLLETIK